jgi:hypothetical protein
MFWSNYCIHLQHQRINQARSQQEAGSKALFAAWLGSFYEPEDGDSMFL